MLSSSYAYERLLLPEPGDGKKNSRLRREAKASKGLFQLETDRMGS